MRQKGPTPEEIAAEAQAVADVEAIFAGVHSKYPAATGFRILHGPTPLATVFLPEISSSQLLPIH
jgi:hypothetical protein